MDGRSDGARCQSCFFSFSLVTKYCNVHFTCLVQGQPFLFIDADLSFEVRGASLNVDSTLCWNKVKQHFSIVTSLSSPVVCVCVFRWCLKLMLKAIVTTHWPCCSVRTPSPPRPWSPTYRTDPNHFLLEVSGQRFFFFFPPCQQLSPTNEYWRVFCAIELHCCLNVLKH